MKAVRWLSSDHAVVPAIKEAGAIPCLVPFLAAERAGAAALGSEVQLEALHALYNICNLNKRVRGGEGGAVLCAGYRGVHWEVVLGILGPVPLDPPCNRPFQPTTPPPPPGAPGSCLHLRRDAAPLPPRPRGLLSGRR